MVTPATTAAPASLYVDYADARAKEDWIAAHDMRHRTYAKIASGMGFPVQAPQLDGEVDRDWFHRHMMAHAALAQLFPGQVGGITPALATTQWRDETAFHDWMHRHALIHARLDAAFGIH